MRKHWAILVLAPIIGIAALSPLLATSAWKEVAAFQYDWDHHGASKFVFEIPAEESSGGKSFLFSRLRIQVPGQKEFVLKNEDWWLDYTDEGASISSKLPKTLAPTSHVLAVKAAENRTLIFLFGYEYGSSSGQFDVLEISEAGQPQVVLHRDEFMLEEVRDLDGDGVGEIVGKPCSGEVWGNDLTTYTPFNVYKLDAAAGGSARLSVPLSKDYNLKHYYGWAGPECSKDFAVVLHPRGGGKPVVASAKDAEKIATPQQ